MEVIGKLGKWNGVDKSNTDMVTISLECGVVAIKGKRNGVMDRSICIPKGSVY